MAVSARKTGIGALSAKTGCHVETIRYYERIGLLPEPPRTTGGHRSYGDEHVRRLFFIRRSRELGFSLDAIRDLLAMVDGGEMSCAQVADMAGERLADVRAKIKDLKKLERTLAQTVSHCHRDDDPNCPVIDALYEGAASS